MYRKVFTYITALGIFFSFLFFNPYLVPGMYFDSSGSFRFQTLTKVLVLSIISIILLVLTLYRTIKEKEISLKFTILQIPVLIFLFSIILSWFLSRNKLISLYGINASFEYSILEFFVLAVFYILVVLNIKKKSDVRIILNALTFSISLVLIWVVFRFASTTSSNATLFHDYINSYLFTPSGHYGTLSILCILSLLISFVFLQKSIKKENWLSVIFHGLNVVIAVGSFVTLYHFLDFQKAVLYLALSLISVLILTYRMFKNPDTTKSYLYSVGTIGVAVLIGFGIYTKFSSKPVSSFAYPATAPSIGWNTAQSGISSNVKTMLFGSGEGTYSSAFDEHKPAESKAYTLTVSSSVPIIPELRYNHAESLLSEILLSQGYFGLLSFLSIVLALLFFGYKSSRNKNSTLMILVLTLLGVLAASLFITGYDFSLLLMLFLFAALCSNFINTEKSLFQTRHKAIKPLLIITYLLLFCGLGGVIFIGSKLVRANKHMFDGYQARITGQQDKYRDESIKAAEMFPDSPVFAREKINADGVDLLRALDGSTTNQGLSKEAANQRLQNVTSQIERLVQRYPDEYKNYYLGGQFFSRVSPYFNNEKDDEAIQYFLKTLKKNTNHPDTYYQLAVLYERKNDITSARSAVENAVRYDQTNIQYQLKYADLLAQSGDTKRALSIYEEFRNIVENNQRNVQLQNIYRAQKIEEKISKLKGKV